MDSDGNKNCLIKRKGYRRPYVEYDSRHPQISVSSFTRQKTHETMNTESTGKAQVETWLDESNLD